jgi:hypothetical protein
MVNPQGVFIQMNNCKDIKCIAYSACLHKDHIDECTDLTVYVYNILDEKYKFDYFRQSDNEFQLASMSLEVSIALWTEIHKFLPKLTSLTMDGVFLGSPIEVYTERINRL